MPVPLRIPVHADTPLIVPMRIQIACQIETETETETRVVSMHTKGGRLNNKLKLGYLATHIAGMHRRTAHQQSS